MAIVLDTATIAVARSAGGPAITTVSATLPLGALILVAVQSDGDVGNTQTATITNSGTALVWTKAVDRNALSGGSGYSAYAGLHWTIGDGAAHTITATMAFAKPVAIKPVIITGARTPRPIGSTGTGDTALSNTTIASYSSTAAGSQGICCGMDWANGSTATSTDSKSTYQVSGLLDGILIWKAAVTGAIGTTVGFNIQMTTTPNWNAVSVEVIPAVPDYPYMIANRSMGLR